MSFFKCFVVSLYCKFVTNVSVYCQNVEEFFFMCLKSRIHDLQIHGEVNYRHQEYRATDGVCAILLCFLAPASTSEHALLLEYMHREVNCNIYAIHVGSPTFSIKIIFKMPFFKKKGACVKKCRL